MVLVDTFVDPPSFLLVQFDDDDYWWVYTVDRTSRIKVVTTVGTNDEPPGS